MNNPARKRKVLYIASIYHSGSTLLDLLASQLPNVVGLGEVSKLIIDGPEDLCSCGKEAVNCEFWSSYLAKEFTTERHVDDAYIASAFHRLWSHIDENFPGLAVVDGSKIAPFKFWGSEIDQRHLLTLYEQDEAFDLIKIFLVKDARAWVASMLRRDMRQVKSQTNMFRSVIRFFKFILFQNWFLRYAQWSYSTYKILRLYKENQENAVVLDYRHVCDETDKVIEMLRGIVGIKENPDMSRGLSHILVGNPSRFNYLERPIIKYDERWKSYISVRIIYMLMPICWFFERKVNNLSLRSLSKSAL